LDLNGSVLSLIDLRSFSSLWFWIVVAVSWSSVTHNALGVPFDMVLRARRKGGVHMDDLEALVAIQLRRRQTILNAAGAGLVAVWAAGLTVLAILGFGYRVELAQALSLLFVPWTLVAGLRLRLMQRLTAQDLRGEALLKALTWHRMGVQTIGLLAILITTLWGMWFILNIRSLGG
jgi:hypothetical protein